MQNVAKKVEQALSTVYDPDLKKDLIALGMIKNLVVGDTLISFTIILTTPACPLKEVLKQACIQAIHNQVSSDFEVIIETTAKVTSSRSKTTVLPEVSNVIAIASGKGGVGKSTIATHLALALSQHGARVGLLDADIFGPSIPTMWGCDTQKPTIIENKGKKYILPISKYGVKLLSIGFLSHSKEAIIWRGPMASAAFKQLIQDSDWGQLDYLFIDLPPGTSDIHLTMVQTVSVTGVIIVTTPQKVALIDAIKAIDMFRKEQIKVPILGLIENMSYFSIEKEAMHMPHYIFGKEGGKTLAEKEGISFLGQVPLLPAICTQGDLGIMGDEIIEPFGDIAQMVAQQIAIQNAAS
ncbi:Mrp/NBP35 family ATP-binding protein [Cardinium endosymbiont of Culicoides punctatus]|uniref:Mrp/NBP35 family ATP-binding protein n=1 Tax=Cardinium endosymbiont of Culicoides punctatus TaxID=2304601 RepID=UPI0010586762|nr:Mrp/NBP35 family ATP-binding protein [Cardinium endosymbiont of Culicoides punctatus]TDG95437.1 Iron-sulfur cluster carrier protein [Cardinium endosymbiont of Culicoides punctatus]